MRNIFKSGGLFLQVRKCMQYASRWCAKDYPTYVAFEKLRYGFKRGVTNNLPMMEVNHSKSSIIGGATTQTLDNGDS
jgi:hypothetical protein